MIRCSRTWAASIARRLLLPRHSTAWWRMPCASRASTAPIVPPLSCPRNTTTGSKPLECPVARSTATFATLTLPDEMPVCVRTCFAAWNAFWKSRFRTAPVEPEAWAAA